MTIEITVESIQVIRGHGPDDVFLHINLPNGIYPYNGKTFVKLQVAAGTAEEYLDKHFPEMDYQIVGP